MYQRRNEDSKGGRDSGLRAWAVVVLGCALALAMTGCDGEDGVVAVSPDTRTCAAYDEAIHLVKIVPEVSGKAVACQGGFVYIANNGEPEFSIVDATDPTSPEVAAVLSDVPGDPYEIAVVGNRVAIGALDSSPDWIDKLLVYDVTDPGSPQLLLERDTGYISAVAFTDSTLMYIEMGDDDVSVLNIARIPGGDELEILGTLPLDHGSGDIAIYENHAFLSGEGLLVINIVDPSDPQVVGEVDSPGTTGALACDGQYVFASNGYGLRSFNVSDPTNPQTLDSETFSSLVKARGMALYGNYALVCEGSDGLFIIDRSNPENLQVVTSIHARNGGYDVAQSGGWAYVVGGNGGLCIYDMADRPVVDAKLSTADLGCGNSYVIDVVPWGQDMVVACHSGKIAIMSVEEGGQTAVQASVDLGHEVTDLAVADSLIACLEPGFPTEMIAVTPGGELEILPKLFVTGTAAVATAGHLYIGGEEGLYTVDIAAPREPVVLGRLDGVYVESLQLHNGLLWAMRMWRELAVISIDEPGAPELLGSLTIPYSRATVEKGQRERYLAMIGDTGFLAQSNSVIVLDLSMPEAPSISGSIVVPQLNWVHSLTLAGGQLVVACEYGGQHLFDITDPLDPVGVGFRGTGLDKACDIGGYQVLYGYQGINFAASPLEVWLPNCAGR